MKNFRFVVPCLIAVCWWAACSGPALAQSFDDLPLPQYEKQLNALLLTRLEAEKKYIADVVKLIDEGKIPRKLVDTSFKWVRNRRPHTRHPFIYFQRVLQLQAKKLKLEVPEFDLSIYSERRR